MINICCLFFNSLLWSSAFLLFASLCSLQIYLCRWHRSRKLPHLCEAEATNPRLGAQPEHREVSCCDRQGTSTATSKSITTGKLGFPKWLERLFPLGQVIAELISWFYVSCLVTARANSSHRILLKKRKVDRQIHSMAAPITLQPGNFGSPQNKFFFVSGSAVNRNN